MDIKRTLATLTLAGTTGFACAQPATAQSPSQAVGPQLVSQIMAAEVAEEAAESAEDASAAPLDQTAAQTHPRYAAQIAYLKKIIRRMHHNNRTMLARPHKTSRWLGRLDARRLRIRSHRLRIRELRARAAAHAS